MIEVLTSDKLFQTSPQGGDPECICSRCDSHIPEEQEPIIRAFVDEGRGGEYRYCRSCIGKSGVMFFDSEEDEFNEEYFEEWKMFDHIPCNKNEEMNIQLSPEAQAYFNEVAYSLDYGDGKVATHSQVINHCLLELAAFEKRHGTSVTDHLRELSEKGVKKFLAQGLLAEAQEASSTPEKAREYLKSQGEDPDAIVENGLAMIKELQDQKQESPAPALPEATLLMLEEKFHAAVDAGGTETKTIGFYDADVAWSTFFPAIQEVIAAEKKDMVEYSVFCQAEQNWEKYHNQVTSSKDAEIKRLMLQIERLTTGEDKPAYVQELERSIDQSVKVLRLVSSLKPLIEYHELVKIEHQDEARAISEMFSAIDNVLITHKRSIHLQRM